jgi:hypothetical protein
LTLVVVLLTALAEAEPASAASVLLVETCGKARKKLLLCVGVAATPPAPPSLADADAEVLLFVAEMAVGSGSS